MLKDFKDLLVNTGYYQRALTQLINHPDNANNNCQSNVEVLNFDEIKKLFSHRIHSGYLKSVDAIFLPRMLNTIFFIE